MTAGFAVRVAEQRDCAAIARLAESSELFPAAMLGPMIAPFFKGEGEARWFVAEADADLLGFLYSDGEMLTEGTHNLRGNGDCR